MHVQDEMPGSRPWLVQHPLSAADEAAMTALRGVVEPNKGKLQGVSARGPFDGIMERVVEPDGVSYNADDIGEIAGWWCLPEDAPEDKVILHLHGGWFNWGSAQAYRHFGGHIAAATGVAVFLPDYRLAPEHPFPAAVEDAQAVFQGLAERGYRKVAVTGDSAGGNLALGLLANMAKEAEAEGAALVGGVALSPVTDLTLSGKSWSSKADADPYFTRQQVSSLVQSYLAGSDPIDPLASPVFSDVHSFAPVRVHVGSDEVLLDDSVRFVERAANAGRDVQLDVWQGMVHGFLGGIGRLEASGKALRLISEFLSARFDS